MTPAASAGPSKKHSNSSTLPSISLFQVVFHLSDVDALPRIPHAHQTRSADTSVPFLTPSFCPKRLCTCQKPSACPHFFTCLAEILSSKTSTSWRTFLRTSSRAPLINFCLLSMVAKSPLCCVFKLAVSCAVLSAQPLPRVLRPRSASIPGLPRLAQVTVRMVVLAKLCPTCGGGPSGAGGPLFLKCPQCRFKWPTPRCGACS